MGYHTIQDSYQGTRVLITGHTGFKGSWLALWLSQLGAHVLGVALPLTTEHSHFNLIQPPIDSHLLDIRDLDALKKVIKEYQPEIIFHLAAQSLVLSAYEKPLESFSTNIIGTAHLFEAIKVLHSLRAVIVVTSDKCYQNQEWLWGYRENEALGGQDPYSLSKACQEHVTTAYRNTYFPIHEFGKKHHVLIATARAGNVIGGGDWSQDRLITDLIKSAVNLTSATIRSPTAIRPWQHVLDCLYGYLKLGAQLLTGNTLFSGAWNFAPLQEITFTVQELCALSQKIWPKIRMRCQDHEPSMLYEARLLRLDASKAQHHLKWYPQLTPIKTIRWTIEWYQQFYETKQLLSLAQLSVYQTDLKKKNPQYAQLELQNTIDL